GGVSWGSPGGWFHCWGGKWCPPRSTACTAARTNPWRWACSGGGGRPGGSWLRRSAGDYGLWQVLAAVSAVTPADRAAPEQAGGMAGVTWPAYCWCKIGSPRVPGSRGGRSGGGCWAVAEPELSFAGVLRQLRAEARLTQEELAEAASLSPEAVSALERGIHCTAHKDTAVLLAGALGLPEQVRIVFVAAARGKAPAADVLAVRQGKALGAFQAAVTPALPRDNSNFTGREAELAGLMEVLAAAAGGGAAGICAIDGMAGIGKTTLAVHAAHRLSEAFPDGQFFLPLHAHTVGQRPVDPADALASLLLTVGAGAAQIPPGLEAGAARWRDHVAGKQILLLLDDASGHEQIRPLLPGTAGSLVLVTSRRRLTALDDAAVISLDVLSSGEAAALLVRLAARPGLRAGDPAVGEIT